MPATKPENNYSDINTELDAHSDISSALKDLDTATWYRAISPHRMPATEEAHAMKHRFCDETIPFLIEAGQQTDPAWLDARQQTYDKLVRLPFIEVAQTLKSELQQIVPDYHFPTRGIGRIRKSLNKVVSGGAHFKDWLSLSASRPPSSRFERNPHLFFGILPDIEPYRGVIVAGGLFMPTGPQLKKVRYAIAANSRPFHDVLDDKAFKARFHTGFSTQSTSARMPRGFDPDHPDAGWLRLKAFLVVKKLSMTEFTSDMLALSIVEDCKQLIRLNRVLEAALDNA